MQKLNIHTLEDLLFFFPRDYEDKVPVFCFIENPEGTSYETKGTACRRCTFFLFNEIPNPIFQQEIITEYLHKIRNLYTIFILKILSLIYKTGEEKQ